MAEEINRENNLDDLLKEIKEKEKKSRELYEAAERQLTVAISAYVAPRDSSPRDTSPPDATKKGDQKPR